MNYTYDEIYLNDAQNQMGSFFYYAFVVYKFTYEDFISTFINSKEFVLLEKGAPHLIAGLSGYELAVQILENEKAMHEFKSSTLIKNQGPYFWMGWALAYYQHHSSHPYKDIVRKVPLEEIYNMHEVYHQMDLIHFVEEMDKRYQNSKAVTKLKEIREKNGLSQSELAKKSGVKLRLIQLYEQRKNDINKGSAIALQYLANALNVSIQDLLEL